MKKITSIILAIALAAGLTGCAATGDKPQSDPDAGSTKNLTVKVPDDNSDDKTDSTPGDKTPDDSSDDKTDDKTSDDRNEGNNDSTPTEDKTDDNKPSEDKTDNSKPAEDKTDDNKPAVPGNNGDVKAAALPLKEYPAGSYFTYNGKPCGDHDSCDWNSECNCVNFDLAIQSPGFARYVYFKVNGKHLSLADKTVKDTDLTADAAKSLLKELPLGAYVAVQTKGDHFHAMAVISADDNGITVYQANYGGGCVVSAPTYSWAEFAEGFPHLNYYVK